jgi:hypothetical protein
MTLALYRSVGAQTPATLTTRPVPHIDGTKDVVTVGVAEFATLPDIAGIAARMMLMRDEPGTRRLFVNDMRGPLYTVSHDGKNVALYVDINDSTWGVHVQAQGRERGFQSFAFHPQFGQRGTPGYGKFYTWSDSRNNTAAVDFKPGGGTNTHHSVLHEWTAKNPAAPKYDGDAPRELMRFEHPFSNHNGGLTAFNPLDKPGSLGFGLLYIGVADGGSGGDPLNNAQNLSSGFGKLFRIDPLGKNSANGKYGIPASNPFVKVEGALPEIYAYGMRNPQRFGWDPANGNLFLADIGQNIVEKISLVTAGANLGWNVWEGSFGYGRGGVDASNPRGDSKVLFPVVEYAHGDSLIQNRAAVTGVHVFRDGSLPVLRNKVMFADIPSGEVFYFDADKVPRGGSADIRRCCSRAAARKEGRCCRSCARRTRSRESRRPRAWTCVSATDRTAKCSY